MTDLVDNEVSAQAAPGPYDTVDVGCGAGFHTYIVDRNGRKIGVVWGPRAEKVWTAALFAGAPDMLHALEMVRDANRDNPHIPPTALAMIEAAINRAGGAL